MDGCPSLIAAHRVRSADAGEAVALQLAGETEPAADGDGSAHERERQQGDGHQPRTPAERSSNAPLSSWPLRMAPASTPSRIAPTSAPSTSRAAANLATCFGRVFTENENTSGRV